MEKILSIQTEFGMDSGYDSMYKPYYDGLMITTDEQVIKIGINNQGQCCEHFGTITSHDDLNDFIGANLIDIQIVDDTLNSTVFDQSLEYAQVMFVNINTTKGTLQLVMYNDHNGYYSHDVVIESTQLRHKSYL